MKLTILIDNTALFDRFFNAEHGFSVYIEADTCKLLFDTGYSGTILTNALNMGIDLANLDYIILSHGHIDHTGGLYHLIRFYIEKVAEGSFYRPPTLIAHPYCFYPRPKPPIPDIGPLITVNEIRRFMPVQLSKDPVQLLPNLFFLGEIKRKLLFEGLTQETRFIEMPDGSIKDDLLIDDSALLYKAQGGLVLITGCAHSGICNTIEHALSFYPNENILDCIGGLHLTEKGPKLNETIEFLKMTNLTALHACHCTSISAKIALADVVPLHETGVGLTLEYDGHLDF